MEAEDYYFANEYHVGISVRDKLAESAMIGILSSFSMLAHIAGKEEDVAKQAYKLADSMIKQSQIKP